MISKFFGTNRQYAVVGASANPQKFGYIVTKWYAARGLNAVPVNPSGVPILNLVTHKSITSALQESLSAGGMSLSFITPPAVTASVVKEIALFSGYEKRIQGLWFQPGSYDMNVIRTVQECGLNELIVPLGECILVRGDEGLESVKL